MKKDYISLPDGSVLVERKTCACGMSVTLFRGHWWEDSDLLHDCED